MATVHDRPDTLRTLRASARGDVPPLQGAWWKYGTGAAMVGAIYVAFFVAKGARGFNDNGDVARVVFFHVPVAVLTSFFYFGGAIFALVCLWKRDLRDADTKSAICMEIGLLVSFLATFTGSVFAHAQWGTYWNWDPRETSIVGLLLLYSSYLVLRSAMHDRQDKRAVLCATYTMITLVPANFLIWVVPRLNLGSMHPTNVLTDPASTSPSYNLGLYVAFVAYTGLFIWLFQLRLRAARLGMRRQREN